MADPCDGCRHVRGYATDCTRCSRFYDDQWAPRKPSGFNAPKEGEDQ